MTQYSPDGRFYWDGMQWVPVPAQPQSGAPQQPPSPGVGQPAAPQMPAATGPGVSTGYTPGSSYVQSIRTGGGEEPNLMPWLAGAGVVIVILLLSLVFVATSHVDANQIDLNNNAVNNVFSNVSNGLNQ